MSKIIALGATALTTLTLAGAIPTAAFANNITQNTLKISEEIKDSQNPYVIDFLKEVKQVLILDENYHALYLTEDATYDKLHETYNKALPLIVSSSQKLSEEDKEFVLQLSQELLRSDIKKKINYSYEFEKIASINAQIDSLFDDSNHQVLKDNITAKQIVNVIKNYILYSSGERRERDEKINSAISELGDKVRKKVSVWTNKFEADIDSLLYENELNDNISQAKITSLANDINDLEQLSADELAQSNIEPEKIVKFKEKIRKAQQLLDQLQRNGNTTVTYEGAPQPAEWGLSVPTTVKLDKPLANDKKNEGIAMYGNVKIAIVATETNTDFKGNTDKTFVVNGSALYKTTNGLLELVNVKDHTKSVKMFGLLKPQTADGAEPTTMSEESEGQDFDNESGLKNIEIQAPVDGSLKTYRWLQFLGQNLKITPEGDSMTNTISWTAAEKDA